MHNLYLEAGVYMFIPRPSSFRILRPNVGDKTYGEQIMVLMT